MNRVNWGKVLKVVITIATALLGIVGGTAAMTQL
ncbi:MAG: smalltalk protein [Prevotella sp.]|nr:smalltalk protein [Prevotella sp.]